MLTQNPINFVTVLTAAQRGGDFSAVSKQLVNPSTGASFAGNEISPTLFDSIAVKLLALLPPMGTYYQGLSLNKNIGTSNHNALIASAQRQVTRGLTFLGDYRWSKCMTTADPTGFNSDVYATPVASADYSRCSYDVTSQFKASFVWELPTTRFGWSAVNKVLSNWMVNGTLTLQAGQPFTVLSGVDNSTSGIGKGRADLIGNPVLSSSRNHAHKVAEYLNIAAFNVNALGTYGDTS
jgi:hypothetical protein